MDERGTVIMCSKAGAEYQLQLLWALSFASVVAFTLQEGAERWVRTSSACCIPSPRAPAAIVSADSWQIIIHIFYY